MLMQEPHVDDEGHQHHQQHGKHPPHPLRHAFQHLFAWLTPAAGGSRLLQLDSVNALLLDVLLAKGLTGRVVEPYVAVADDEKPPRAVGLQGQDGIAVLVGGIVVGGELSVLVAHQGAEDGGQPKCSIGGEGHCRNIFRGGQHHLFSSLHQPTDVATGAEPKVVAAAEG